MTSNSAVYAVIPIAIVFIILKICLIVWRLYVRQQRREAMHRSMLLANHITVDRPEYVAGQMSFNGLPPSWLVHRDSSLVYPGRCGVDANLPPSYEQAITGEDHATTLEGESALSQQPLLLHYALPPPSSRWAPLQDSGSHPLLPHSEEPLPPYTPTAAVFVPPLPSPSQQNC